MDNVRSEDQQGLANIVSACKANYLDKADEIRRVWGGGIRGTKSCVFPIFGATRTDVGLPQCCEAQEARQAAGTGLEEGRCQALSRVIKSLRRVS